MKRKAFTLTLAAFLLASLAACSNGTNSSKTANETTSAVETSFSENAHSDIIRICRGLAQLATKRQSLPAKKHGCMPM